MRLSVVLDCADPERAAGFWAPALGYHREPFEDPYLVLRPDEEGAGPELVLQRVAEPKVAKNRMHLDLTVDDVDGEVDRLVALGATRQGAEVAEGDYRWFVLADPGGNELCVIGRTVANPVDGDDAP